jgi:hypothetical protein
MNNTLHTPGLWKCNLVSLKIWANDGNTEISRTSSDVSISEEEANARLISSAPDMLEALQAICDAFGDQDSLFIDQCKAAISKAKGVLP